MLAATTDASALSFGPRNDLAIVALDTATGERRWTHYPEKLSEAVCELYPELLVVTGNFVSEEEPAMDITFSLDPATGEARSEEAPGTPPLARSGTFHIGEVELQNGWRLDPGFSSGNDMKLDFIDAQGSVVWSIDTGAYPDEVAAWGNTAFYAFGYLSDDATIYAYQAGTSAPSFTFDPNTAANTPKKLTRPYIEVFGDDLFVGAQEHLFQLDAATGAVERHWDLVSLTGVPFEDAENAFFRGGLNLGTLSADSKTVVVGFEGRLIALDRGTGDLLWHRDPDTLPFQPFPLVHGDLVVVTGGELLAGPRHEPEPGPEMTANGGCSVGATPFDASAGVAAVAGALFALAQRRRRGASPRV